MTRHPDPQMVNFDTEILRDESLPRTRKGKVDFLHLARLILADAGRLPEGSRIAWAGMLPEGLVVFRFVTARLASVIVDRTTLGSGFSRALFKALQALAPRRVEQEQPPAGKQRYSGHSRINHRHAQWRRWQSRVTRAGCHARLWKAQ